MAASAPIRLLCHSPPSPEPCSHTSPPAGASTCPCLAGSARATIRCMPPVLSWPMPTSGQSTRWAGSLSTGTRRLRRRTWPPASRRQQRRRRRSLPAAAALLPPALPRQHCSPAGQLLATTPHGPLHCMLTQAAARGREGGAGGRMRRNGGTASTDGVEPAHRNEHTRGASTDGPGPQRQLRRGRDEGRVGKKGRGQEGS